MSVSTNDKRLLLILLGLAVFLVSYFGVSKVYNAKQATVETEISALSPQLETLRAYNNDQAKYQAEIETMSADIAAQLANYPGDIRSEDMIMFVTALEDKVGISVSDFSVASPTLLTTFNLPKEADSGLSSYRLAAFQTGLSASCTMTYTQMKDLVNYIYASKDKTNIDDIALSYSADTGALSASLTLSRYFLVSPDYVYNETTIPSVSKGVSNPFGTVATMSDTQTTISDVN